MLAKALLNITEPYQEAVFKALVDTVYPSGKKDLIQVKDLYCITQHVNECGVASNVATDFQLGEFVIAQDLNDSIAEIRDDIPIRWNDSSRRTRAFAAASHFMLISPIITQKSFVTS